MAAAKVKVIELAKELGVTSKDLMLAAEEMGHKGVRAMTPLDSKLANELRVKLGKGRELPEEPAAKPKRVAKPKTTEDGAEPFEHAPLAVAAPSQRLGLGERISRVVDIALLGEALGDPHDFGLARPVPAAGPADQWAELVCCPRPREPAQRRAERGIRLGQGRVGGRRARISRRAGHAHPRRAQRRSPAPSQRRAGRGRPGRGPCLRLLATRFRR